MTTAVITKTSNPRLTIIEPIKNVAQLIIVPESIVIFIELKDFEFLMPTHEQFVYRNEIHLC